MEMVDTTEEHVSRRTDFLYSSIVIKMIERSTDYETNDGKPYNSICCLCNKKLDDTWINYIPFGDLCITCAHTTMRILLQDIISYHNNGVSISLLDVMYHGRKDNLGHKRKDSLFDF